MPSAKKRLLRTYPEVVKYLLQIYATDDVIAKTNIALTRFTQFSTMLPTQYARALAPKLRYKEGYVEYVLKMIFIGGHHE